MPFHAVPLVLDNALPNHFQQYHQADCLELIAHFKDIKDNDALVVLNICLVREDVEAAYDIGFK